MAKILSGSIDLNKIDKSKIILVGKDGNPFKNGAKYLNVQVSVNDSDDQYGNRASISINQSKEEREAKEKRTYIGNLKQVWTDENNNIESAEVIENETDDGLGF